MKIIAHILLFYFTLGACLPKCDFSQLTKMADLMEHYDLHELEAELKGETFSILDFVYLHFIEGDEHHDDSTDHENLPLKNIVSLTFYFCDKSVEPNLSTSFLSIKNFFVAKIYPKEFCNKIFQPPILLS